MPNLKFKFKFLTILSPNNKSMRVGRNSPTNNKYFFRLANRSKCQENINEEEDDLTRTWVGVRWIRAARCSRSGALRYFCCLNRLSSSWTCCWVNRTRRFRLCGRWGNCIAPTPMPTPTPTPTPTPMPDDLVTSPIDWPTEQPAMLVPAPAAAAPISRETATQHSKYQSRYSSRCTNKQKNNIILHSRFLYPNRIGISPLLPSYCARKNTFYFLSNISTHFLYFHREKRCSIAEEQFSIFELVLRLYSRCVYSTDGEYNLSGWNLRRQIAKRRGETREACPREKGVGGLWDSSYWNPTSGPSLVSWRRAVKNGHVRPGQKHRFIPAKCYVIEHGRSRRWSAELLLCLWERILILSDSARLEKEIPLQPSNTERICLRALSSSGKNRFTEFKNLGLLD